MVDGSKPASFTFRDISGTLQVDHSVAPGPKANPLPPGVRSGQVCKQGILQRRKKMVLEGSLVLVLLRHPIILVVQSEEETP